MWSFQFRHSLGMWFNEINKLQPKKVFVFCSAGGGKDPGEGDNETENLDKHIHSMYRPVNEDGFKEMPNDIEVTLPSKTNKGVGSAFIVEKIITSIYYEKWSLDWLKKDGKWQTAPLPTRGEFLIRLGTAQPMRKVRAILELKYPYLAEIKK